MMARLHACGALAAALVAAVMIGGLCPASRAQLKRWQVHGEFVEGVMISLNDPNDALQLTDTGTPLPFLYVPLPDFGTVARIDAESGAILGEYLTAPEFTSRSPFAVAVDRDGNCWVANSGEDSPCNEPEPFTGSVLRIGIVLGGTRTDAAGHEDPNGEYLKPPFPYNTCIDRDGDKLIHTSRGLGDVLAWLNGGGEDSCGGVSTAEDECITLYTRVPPERPRTLAVTADDDLWVGGPFSESYDDHVRLRADTGEIVEHLAAGCGGEGGIVDRFGILWSGPGGNDGEALRFDPRAGSPECFFDPGWGF